MSKTYPLVSTLICTYNAELFFDATIRSVLDQTYTNQEILIRDDGSSDGTVELLTQRSKKDARIRIFVEPWVKRGPYGGLNHLLDHAQGTYIAIQDHDDIWHPEKLEKQVKFLERNGEYEGCGSKFRCYFESIECFGPGIGIDAWGQKKVVHHTSLIYRNSDKRYDLRHEQFTDFYFCRDILGLQYELDDIYMIHRKRAGNKNLFNTRTTWFWSRLPLRKSNPSLWRGFYYVFLKIFGTYATLWVSRNITRRWLYISYDIFVKQYPRARMHS